MAVQPIPAIAVNEQVFFSLVGVQPDQIGILRCVSPETKRKAVVEAALRVFLAEIPHGVAVLQKSAVLLIVNKSLNDVLQLLLKFPGV